MSEATTFQANGPSLTEVVSLRVSRNKLKSAVNGLTTERDTLRNENVRLASELQAAKQAADTGASQKRVKELEQQIRTRDHKAAFEKQAKKSGIAEDRIEAAWKLSEYKADGDLNEDAINSSLDALKESNGWIFGEAPPATEGDPPAKPANGAGKGGNNKSTSGDADIIPDDDPRWNDSVWQMNNRDKIIASSKEKMRRGLI